MQRLAVIAHPGSRAERVTMLDYATLGVWVRARPVDGQANAAIERAIATALGLRPRQVKIVAGLASRSKIVEIDVGGPETLRSRFVASRLQAE